MPTARGHIASGTLRPLAVTSARRYLTRGVLRTWLRNAGALVAWRAGVDRDRIARWYRR